MSIDFPWFNTPIEELPFVVLDLETTGFKPPKARITEIALITMGPEPEVFDTLINPGVPIPREIIKLTGITEAMVKEAPPIKEVLSIVEGIFQDSIFVSHNVPFDWAFLDHAFKTHFGKALRMPSLCTLKLARRFLDIPSNKLGKVAEHFKISLLEAHRALDDAQAAKEILQKFFEILPSQGIKTGGDLFRKNLIYPVSPPPR